jgi:hypothetical protein
VCQKLKLSSKTLYFIVMSVIRSFAQFLALLPTLNDWLPSWNTTNGARICISSGRRLFTKMLRMTRFQSTSFTIKVFVSVNPTLAASCIFVLLSLYFFVPLYLYVGYFSLSPSFFPFCARLEPSSSSSTKDHKRATYGEIQMD